MAPEDGHGAAGLREYLQAVKRRKWVIVQAIVLVPLAAVLYSMHEKPVYQASAQVLLSDQSLAEALGTQQPSSNIPDTTLVATQAQLAGVPAIGQRAVAQLHLKGMTPRRFLASCGVASSLTTDILTFTCNNGDAVLAERMVNAYSLQYTLYRRQLDTNAIGAALRQVDRKIRQLNAGGEKGPVVNTLEERAQELQTMADLQTSNATVVKSASNTAQVSPRTTRNGVLGLILGIVLGLGLAFLREALDTRVRSAQEISERLELPLLGRIPEPPKRLRGADKLVMLEEPESTSAEALRVLRTNLEFAALDRELRTVMITSAVEQEGKSTTIANLAIALARGGKRVILVDLDLRRPYVDKFFDLGVRPGITQVVIGRASLGDALTLVPIAAGQSKSDAISNGRNAVRGQLAVLGTGPIPPDPGEFVSSKALSSVLAQLRKVADIVLIDAPPLLNIGDALVLSAHVDALLLATRLEKLKRPMLAEVHRLLKTVPSHVFGFVVTGAEAEAGYRYEYGDGYDYRAPKSRQRVEDLVQ